MAHAKLDLSNTEVAFRRLNNCELRKTVWLYRMMANPLLARFGPPLVSSAFNLSLPIDPIVRRTLFSLFCGGESIEQAESLADELARFGVSTVLDYAVEGSHDAESIDATKAELKRVIERVAKSVSMKFAVFKPSALAESTLLTKASAGDRLLQGEKQQLESFRTSILELCAAAAEAEVPIMIDAEESWIQNAVDLVVYDAMRRHNIGKTIVYNTYQTYRIDGVQRLAEAHRLAHAGGFSVGAKIVRGAYMEKERARAKRHGYPSPIQHDKASTDNEFNAAITFCLEKIDAFSIIVASHNAESCLITTRAMKQRSLEPGDPRVYFAQLLGMSDNLTFNLGERGYNALKYIPYGPVGEVLPYLLRRAEENSAISGQMSRERSLLELELKRRQRSTEKH